MTREGTASRNEKRTEYSDPYPTEILIPKEVMMFKPDQKPDDYSSLGGTPTYTYNTPADDYKAVKSTSVLD